MSPARTITCLPVSGVGGLNVEVMSAKVAIFSWDNLHKNVKSRKVVSRHLRVCRQNGEPPWDWPRELNLLGDSIPYTRKLP